MLGRRIYTLLGGLLVAFSVKAGVNRGKRNGGTAGRTVKS